MVLEAEGQPIETTVELHSRKACASTKGARRRIAVPRVPRFTVQDWEGWQKAKVEEREGFLNATKARIQEAFQELREARALILDIRGNEGGTDLLGIRLAEHLLPGPFTYFSLQARLCPERADHYASRGVPHDPRRVGWSEVSPHEYGGGPVPARFQGKLLLLIDEKVFSTADNFVACIADYRTDRVLIGRPTHGGTGAPVPLATLKHSGAVLTLTTMKVYRKDQELIEGRGTRPDVEVRWTRQDLLSGRGPDLEKALEVAGEGNAP